MIKNVLLLIFLVLSGFYSHSQNTDILDSLMSLVEKGNNDTNQVKVLIGVADKLSLTNPKRSIEYAHYALKISGKLNWKKGTGDSYSEIASIYYTQGNFSAALENWQNELIQRIETKDYKSICSALGNIGVIYFLQSNYTASLRYYIVALKQAEAIKDKNKIIANLCNIAMIYKAQDNYEKALEYHMKALDLSEENNDNTFITSSLGSIGGIYWKQFKYNKALEYYFKALEIDKKSGKKRNIAAWLSNIGAVYVDSLKIVKNKDSVNELLSKALEYNLKALKVVEEIGDDGIRTYVYSCLGYIYTENEQYDNAKIYLEKSLELAIKNNAQAVIKDDHYYFSTLYEKTNKPTEAYEHYKLYVAAKDSIFNEKNKKSISELLIKYETENKEKENEILTKQNNIQLLQINNDRYLRVGLIGLLAFVLSIAILLIRQYKLKSHKLAVEFEQKLLRTQMNPHFIFNSLASIESFIYENQPKEAGMYLSSFSRLIRLILENSTSEYISLEKEVETLHFYLSLEKLRLNDALDYSIEVDRFIEPALISLPPMLTQPFLENAIEHGFRGINKAGCINVKFNLEGSNLEVQITDNGIGIAQAQQQKDLNKIHKSMAMKITQERLKFLNKSKKQKLNFSLTDVLNENKEICGTKVIFKIPL